jgi:hypothetical protein
VWNPKDVTPAIPIGFAKFSPRSSIICSSEVYLEGLIDENAHRRVVGA